MIIFDLGCPDDHRFEGWFRSADEFEAQLADDMIACPHCGSHDVRRLPSAHVATAHDSVTATAATTPRQSGAMPAPAEIVRAVIQHLVTHSDDVGSEFAAEARRMHYHESPERAIRGKASEAEFEALQEEGIDVFRLPKLNPEDFN